MDDFEKLTLRQGSLLTYLNNFKANLAKKGQAALTVEGIEARQDLLEKYWTEFRERDGEILEFEVPDDCTYINEGQYQDGENAYLDASAHLKALYRKLRPDSRPSGAGGSSQPSASLSQLPTLQLPKFNGDPLQWDFFRDRFTAMVHNVAHVSDGTKLQHLLGCLQGDAARLVANTTVEDANYQGVWDKLVKRYGNKRILLRSHLKRLLELPRVSKGTAAELKLLVDGAEESVRAITHLDRPVNHWDDWLVHLMVEKLDDRTRVAWETSLSTVDAFPTFKEVTTFLEKRLQALDVVTTTPSVKTTSSTAETKPKKISSLATATQRKGKKAQEYSICQGTHFFSYCPRFKKYTPSQRREYVQKLTVCPNCFKSGHSQRDCPAANRCLACGQQHHTMLHNAFNAGDPTAGPGTPTDSLSFASTSHQRAAEDLSASKTTTLNIATAVSHEDTVLSTALVVLESHKGAQIVCRALLDTASDESFITEKVANLLRLPRTAVSWSVHGFADKKVGVAKGQTSLFLRSRINPNFVLPLKVCIAPKLTSDLPSRDLDHQPTIHAKSLNLADPDFAKSAPIDAILGADVFGNVLRDGVVKGSTEMPPAFNTELGWVVIGKPSTAAASKSNATILVSHLTTEPGLYQDLHERVNRLWEMEQILRSSQLTPEDQRCEDYFHDKTLRDPSKHYMVRLPFKDSRPELGDTRRQALRILYSNERRHRSNPAVSQAYVGFMKEYLQLGHMLPVPPTDLAESAQVCYLPHHAAFKAHDPAKKIRVVFNASQKDIFGVSLNECLLAGPKLQAELWAVLTRWRLYRIVFTADIVKMFRQILIHPDDRNYQRILWRNSEQEEVQEFCLTTVTYGTAPAPYLALKVLRQLAEDEKRNFTLGAQVIRTNTYVDDVLSGADTLEEAREKKEQSKQILQAGGFQLGKWASNVNELIHEETKTQNLEKSIKTDDAISTLGLKWNPGNDCFSFNVEELSEKKVSKRTVLSDTSKLFDPMGWLAPIVITGKILIQDLWISSCDWDDQLPGEPTERWNKFRSSLKDVECLEIPRWTHYDSSAPSVQLHGFSDASQRAYAAVVYLRVTSAPNEVHTSLLVAKTRVAPVKTISLPRLELCGAVLLSRLVTATIKELNLNQLPVFLWTDSQVVLAWLQAHSSRWTTFVANRVSEVQTLTSARCWRHVPSADNPADCATRGLSPNELREHSIWWNGPSWLDEEETHWPVAQKNVLSEAPEEKKSKVYALVAQENLGETMLNKYSSLNRLLRVTAYILRWRRPKKADPTRDTKPLWLCTHELKQSLLFWIKLTQRIYFSEEIRALQGGKILKETNSLKKLLPFIDQEGVLRVGGRLDKAPISFNERHPTILPKESRLSELIVDDAHKRTLHGGPQLTTSYVLRRFWIFKAKVLVRDLIYHCPICTRHRAKMQTQLMGQLPSYRVSAARPFLNSGVDYAGPFQIRCSPGRGQKSYKGYLCLFVCLSSRAIHLEVVSSLSTPAFLAAFKRFVSRRGRCALMLSDNGTNFKGADIELSTMFRRASDFYNEAAEKLANDGTEWRFIPPYAPHFGGLWEAGVKSVKYHLRRIIGNATLTYEEFTTVTTQIEACLNSRPICAMSSDPSDLACLTPGHFLIGTSITAVPEPSLADENANHLSRWHLLTHLRDSFWRIWSVEFLHNQQQRTKWVQETRGIREGDLVLVRDDQLPPTKWKLARVTSLHRGKDGLPRVATLKTSDSTIKRAIARLCLIPLAQNDAPAPANATQLPTAGGAPATPDINETTS